MEYASRPLAHPDLGYALFSGEIQGAVVTLYQNERPPCGLSGWIDWHFQGAISRCIQSGAISGQIGECIYFPFTRNESVYHVFLAGAGYSQAPGVREKVPEKTIQVIQKNLVGLRFEKVGISQSDFGNASPAYFEKLLKGVPLWITP